MPTPHRATTSRVDAHQRSINIHATAAPRARRAARCARLEELTASAFAHIIRQDDAATKNGYAMLARRLPVALPHTRFLKSRGLYRMTLLRARCRQLHTDISADDDATPHRPGYAVAPHSATIAHVNMSLLPHSPTATRVDSFTSFISHAGHISATLLYVRQKPGR